MIEQRVAASEQEHVEVHMLQRLDTDLPLIDAEPDCADQALVLQFAHRAITAVEKLAEIGVVSLAVNLAPEIVSQQDVNPVALEAQAALLERAQHAIVTIVEMDIEGVGADEPMSLDRGVRRN